MAQRGRSSQARGFALVFHAGRSRLVKESRSLPRGRNSDSGKKSLLRPATLNDSNCQQPQRGNHILKTWDLVTPLWKFFVSSGRKLHMSRQECSLAWTISILTQPWPWLPLARQPFEPFHAIGQCAALSQTTIRPAHAFAGSRLNPLWLYWPSQPLSFAPDTLRARTSALRQPNPLLLRNGRAQWSQLSSLHPPPRKLQLSAQSAHGR